MLNIIHFSFEKIMKEMEQFLKLIKYIFNHIYFKIIIDNNINKKNNLFYTSNIFLEQNIRLIASNDICIIIFKLKISVRLCFFEFLNFLKNFLSSFLINKGYEYKKIDIKKFNSNNNLEKYNIKNHLIF